MTRENYEYLKSKCKLPAAILGYTVEEGSVVKIGKGSIIVSLRGDQDERNIEKMTAVESISGFMFWNNSKDGEVFYSKNKEAIADFFVQAFLAS